MKSLLRVRIQSEHDVVLVRQRARQVAAALGFGTRYQTQLATAASEIARNAHQYGGGGDIEFLIDDEGQPPAFLMRVRDRGPGVERLSEVLGGSYRSSSGLGLGILGARRLMERFELESEPGEGTTVLFGRSLPADAPPVTAERLAEIADDLATRQPQTPFAEVLQQNQELLTAYAELQERHRELTALNHKLELLVTSKDRFMAVLGHELRNMLGALQTALTVLGRGTSADDQAEMRQVAQRQVEHLTRLVDDLLDASRIAAGRLELKRRRLDLVREVERQLDGDRDALEEAGLELHVELPRPPVWIDADSTRLAQVIGNLLSNARKFTDPGDRVEVKVRPDPIAGQVTIEVRDTGCGIDAGQLETIFRPFTQAEAARNRMTGGLGLGLPIVQGLIEAHGGVLTAESGGPGQGAVFRVTLPLAEMSGQASVDDLLAASVTAPPVEIEAGAASARLAGGAASASSAGEAASASSAGADGKASGPGDGAGYAASTNGGRRILLIDDHRDSVVGLAQLLTLEGHRVEIAGDGPSGIEAAADFEPDIVICDLGLPQMDGYEVATRLRRLPATAEKPLYALSGFADQEAVTKAQQAGFDDHLTKPVDFERLSRLLEG